MDGDPTCQRGGLTFSIVENVAAEHGWRYRIFLDPTGQPRGTVI